MSRSLLTRRSFAALLPLAAVVACSNGVGSGNATKIDQDADTALGYLYQSKPDARTLADRSAGMLVMPQVTQAGLWFGGGYGRGALRIGGNTVDYYSATQGSFGLQVGAQQYSYVLFFMTSEALREFRSSSGWTAGASIRYVLSDKKGSYDVNTDSVRYPVVGVVFAQTGLIAGATVEGTKYTRIIP